MDLAVALNDAGIDCRHGYSDADFPSIQIGYCDSAEKGLVLTIYRSSKKYRRFRTALSNGSDGPTIIGPNWSIGGIDKTSAEQIIDGIGGRVVGTVDRS